MLLMAVANGGIVYKPKLVDKLLTADGELLEQKQSEVLHTIYLRPDVWDIIRQGLVAVTTRGTGKSVFADLNIKVAGKSGSAETGRKTTHSWFACYAPADDPQIAVAVLVEEGGEGSVAAAPVTRKILEA
ncbi:MAG: penicillin-binding protein 2, partial [Anaerospora sp.]|nr:penicillin-binding protein 2 [Anaerospora sp.]